MEQDILDYLNTQSVSEWVKINDFLLSKYNDDNCDQIRTALIRLISNGKIEVKNNAHRKLCGGDIMLDGYKNEKANLKNWPIIIKFTSSGRNQYLEEKTLKKSKPKWRTKEFYIEEGIKEIFKSTIKLVAFVAIPGLCILLYNTYKDKTLKKEMLKQKEMKKAVPLPIQKQKDTAHP